MEQVVSITNLQAALKRVEANRGSPGIDGMSTDELRSHLRATWKELTRALLEETYRPQAVKRQEIPKESGGVRILGIPTALDRLIQQALLQVLQPIFDPTFSDSSFGFRPGRSAHDAIARARGYIQAGRRVVVDVDLEKFFDRVNHDVLMGRVARRIEDRRVLRLIRRYLDAGLMAEGVVLARAEGTPGRPALAAVGERALGRGGQGPGAQRPRIRALRGRLQRVRALETRRRPG